MQHINIVSPHYNSHHNFLTQQFLQKLQFPPCLYLYHMMILLQVCFSWVGQSGPPLHLNEVFVELLAGHLTEHEILALGHAVKHLYQIAGELFEHNI